MRSAASSRVSREPWSIADQVFHFGRAQELRIDPDMVAGIEANMIEGDADELTDRVRLASRDHIVVGLVLLQHQPHGFDVVLGIAPVALGVEVAEGEFLLEAELDRCCARGSPCGSRTPVPAAAFVVEEDSRAGERLYDSR